MAKHKTPAQRRVSHILEVVNCCVIGLIVIPSYFLFHMITVRPEIMTMYQKGAVENCWHIILSVFFFINVAGNMYMGVFSQRKSRIQKPQAEEPISKNDMYCEICKVYRPPNGWHCDKCNACIVFRDHHCLFFSCCIGRYNHRYYLLYLIYTLISVVYAGYYDAYFIGSQFEYWIDFLIPVFSFFNPLVRVLAEGTYGMRDVYVYLFIINIGVTLWLVGLIWFHIRKAIRGLTSYEFKNGYEGDLSQWKENLLKIFGRRWYVAIVWPFAESECVEIDDLKVR